MEGQAGRSAWEEAGFDEVRLDRRRFLIAAGAAAAAAALAPGQLLAARGRRPVVPLQPRQLPAAAAGDPLQTARAVIAAAILAPSVCNSQPWRFEVEGWTIRLLGDPSRALSTRDPDRLDFVLSLGCALENLLVAARRHGFRPVVTYLPNDGARGVVAEIRLEPGEPMRDAGLFDAIPARRTNRRGYDGRALTGEHRALLEAQVGEESLRLLWLEGEQRLRALGELAGEAERVRMLDPRAEADFADWLRFSSDEQRATGDGLSMDALRLGGPARWLGRRAFKPGGRMLRFGAAAEADQARDGIRSAAALGLLVSRASGDHQRLMAGQVFERIALKATQLEIAYQPLNAMVHSDRARADLRQAFGFRDQQPMMLLRFGRAKPVPPTPRRALALVTTFRMT
jgi:nitroreductase